MEASHLECQGPTIQIMPVENGYLITAYNSQSASAGVSEMGSIANSIINSINSGSDPISAFKKGLDQSTLRESVRRKPIEHHVSKDVEETLKLIREILGSMKM